MKSQHLKIFERYSNNEMDSREKAEFEERLRNDEVFLKDYEEYKEIYESIGDKEVIELRKQLKKIGGGISKNKKRGPGGGLDRRWFWLAAVFIVSLSIVSITYLWITSPMNSRFQGFGWLPEKTDSLIYELDPTYKELLRYRVRSDEFNLDQPRDSLVVSRNSSIQFVWRSRISEPVYFDILNKNGKLVFSAGKPIESPFIFKEHLPRGIYVYRFRTPDITIHTGLFYIV
jgi:hypothetical protein